MRGYHKKFWEELIAYFTLIRHAPPRKQKKNYGGIHKQAERKQDDLISLFIFFKRKVDLR
jgi:hypothetical protein